MKRAILSLLALAACGSPQTIPLPEGTRTLVAVTIGEDEPEVTITEVTEASVALSLDRVGSISLYAFACPPSRFGLTSGNVSLSEHVATGDLLPDPLAILHGETGFGVVPTFEEVESLPSEVVETVRRLPLSHGNRCRSTRARYVVEEILHEQRRDQPAFAVTIDEDHVLVGGLNRRPMIVSKEGEVEPSPAPEVLLGAWLAPSGVLWSLDQNNVLRRGPALGPYEVVTASSAAPFAPGGRRSMSGPRGDEPFELFVASNVGEQRRLSRFDGERWTLLAENKRADDFFHAGVVWIAPGEAVAIGMVPNLPHAVIRVKDGVVSNEILSAESEEASSISWAPGVGPVIMRFNGQIDLYRNKQWTPIEDTMLTHYPRAITPIADGFLYGTSTALNWLESGIGQYYPRVGACPLEVLTPEMNIGFASYSDGTVLAVTINEGWANYKLFMFRPIVRGRDCGVPP
jgi:hypothetical protein